MLQIFHHLPTRSSPRSGLYREDSRQDILPHFVACGTVNVGDVKLLCDVKNLFRAGPARAGDTHTHTQRRRCYGKRRFPINK